MDQLNTNIMAMYEPGLPLRSESSVHFSGRSLMLVSEYFLMLFLMRSDFLSMGFSKGRCRYWLMWKLTDHAQSAKYSFVGTPAVVCFWESLIVEPLHHLELAM